MDDSTPFYSDNTGWDGQEYDFNSTYNDPALLAASVNIENVPPHQDASAAVGSQVPSTKSNKYPPKGGYHRAANRPAWSFAQMAALAINNSQHGMMSVSEIYKYIIDEFPYYRTAAPGWKNSVRHALSMGTQFEKVQMSGIHGEGRKNCLWSIREGMQEKIDAKVHKQLIKEEATERYHNEQENTAPGAPPLITKGQHEYVYTQLAKRIKTETIGGRPLDTIGQVENNQGERRRKIAPNPSFSATVFHRTIKQELDQKLAIQPPPFRSYAPPSRITKETEDNMAAPNPSVNQVSARTVSRVRPSILHRRKAPVVEPPQSISLFDNGTLEDTFDPIPVAIPDVDSFDNFDQTGFGYDYNISPLTGANDPFLFTPSPEEREEWRRESGELPILFAMEAQQDLELRASLL